MAKPNYRHAKKQRELAKKARRAKKEMRQSNRNATPAQTEPGSTVPDADPVRTE